ncbi:protein of unknown function [Eubacterium pyruvativorans]|uniref:DUF4358 domain-containing protein n=1 Tax=Eubacterium pyruvativorans TaxID=155865 RepID=A0A1I7F5G8_9FIRM|nr:DUF4358 domain-containing protein [Eubacterium pyruvativorans]SFO05304.1 protein of unknown function [Eubacterium pyruvativorans]SFU31409.1 protein of unknown function [Eubacterium pyruvativorans]
MMNETKKNEILARITDSRVTKIILILLLIGFLAAVYHMNSAKDVSVSRIDDALRSETKIKSMQKCSSRQLMQFMGLNASHYDGFLYYRSREALGVDEVLVVKARQKSDLSAVEDAVEDRIDNQIRTYEGYGPEQVSRLQNAVVTKRGNFLFYATAKDPSVYEEVFLHVI